MGEKIGAPFFGGHLVGRCLQRVLPATGVARNQGHTPPLGWFYDPRTSPTVGPYGGSCP